MEQIMYRKTLDVHKNGTQFLLQGFETADNLSRVVEISLMASGDAIDFPLEKIVAIMYVSIPGATEPSIYNCTIKDNKVVFEMPKISVEGITTMQLKLIETSTDGARSVLASPKFACEVIKSNADDESIIQGENFTRFEDAVAKAKEVYDERFLRMELDSECIFRAYYADGTTYETDVLQRLFRNGNVLLSESWAKGGTGVRAGEDTNNSMYYSNVSKSESLNAKAIMEDSEEILEEVKLHGVYTAFSVDFETGEVEYVSPSFSFKVNTDTGELDAEGQSYTFIEEIYRVIDEWLLTNDIKLNEIQALADRITPIDKGGTAADNVADARTNLSVYSKEEICDADTSALFDLPEGSIPKDIFDIIGSTRLRMQRGSYVGDGNYGADFPNRIPIDERPAMVIIVYAKQMILYIEGMNAWAISSGKEYVYSDTNDLTFTMSDNAISWYGKSASGQLNSSQTEYTYYLYMGGITDENS